MLHAVDVPLLLAAHGRAGDELGLGTSVHEDDGVVVRMDVFLHGTAPTGESQRVAAARAQARPGSSGRPYPPPPPPGAGPSPASPPGGGRAAAPARFLSGPRSAGVGAGGQPLGQLGRGGADEALGVDGVERPEPLSVGHEEHDLDPGRRQLAELAVGREGLAAHGAGHGAQGPRLRADARAGGQLHDDAVAFLGEPLAPAPLGQHEDLRVGLELPRGCGGSASPPATSGRSAAAA